MEDVDDIRVDIAGAGSSSGEVTGNSHHDGGCAGDYPRIG